MAIEHAIPTARTGLSVYQVRRGMGALIAAGLATTLHRALAGRMVYHVRLGAPALA